MVTDYSKINKFVKRPVHPFPSVADIIRLLGSSPKGMPFTATSSWRWTKNLRN